MGEWGGGAVVTVNDYLAARDAEWMGRVHRFLGLSVGVVTVRGGGQRPPITGNTNEGMVPTSTTRSSDALTL